MGKRLGQKLLRRNMKDQYTQEKIFNVVSLKESTQQNHN